MRPTAGSAPLVARDGSHHHVVAHGSPRFDLKTAEQRDRDVRAFATLLDETEGR